jgi:hypothetical protein
LCGIAYLWNIHVFIFSVLNATFNAEGCIEEGQNKCMNIENVMQRDAEI